MEAGWRSSFSSSCSGGDGGVGGGRGSDSGGQNGNFAANNAWDIWDIGTTATPTTANGTRYDWSNHDASSISGATTAARRTEASVVHALLLGVTNDNTTIQNAGVGSNSVHRRMPDPHMMCLKLGKRHYCGDSLVPDRHMAAESSSTTKRGKPPYPYHMTDTATTTTTITVWPASSPAAAPPRCQVEGCGVALSNTKEYYRRHKVCEIHSKAPKVVVLGLQQRFCQQCSRFHSVTEFDEAKRSCRRRLEGHNQRRRKGTLPNSLPRNFHHSHGTLMAEQQLRPSPPYLKPGCALSLLSSPKIEPWMSSGDLSVRCSAALSELIAANRATAVVGHFWNQDGSQPDVMQNAIHTPSDSQMWDRFSDDDHSTMTLDLMQASSSCGFWPFVHEGEV